jgi:predicted RNase H-like HicB family nuclease
MLKTYTAKYTRISSGYMGQLVEWPEVITEGESLEACRELLQDALRETIAAYRQQGKEIPPGVESVRASSAQAILEESRKQIREGEVLNHDAFWAEVQASRASEPRPVAKNRPNQRRKLTGDPP